MSYQVTARKWRPQVFADVVGQDAVVRSLSNALETDRVAHAFLFSGVRGVGKTTTARILARCLNCREGLSPQPCGSCASCEEIAESRSIDVLEIDAASNTGVDNIRELRESSRYGTARDRYKIFIIDEVHMLSKGAFNALLKTLEEPPDHVKFILATTEDQKVPVTIRSRCQHYHFRPIPFPLILERLQLIVEKEGVSASDYALRAIAARAEGSMRDAQSALDQVIAFAGAQVDDDDVNQVLGVVDRSLVADVFDAVLARDRERLLRTLLSLGETGTTPADFCHGLVSYLRVLMLCRSTGFDSDLLEVGESDRERVEAHAGQVSEIDLIRFYDVVSATEADLKWHRHPQAHLEISLLKLVELTHLPRLEKVLAKLGSGQPPPQPADSGENPTPSENSSAGPSTASAGKPAAPATGDPVSQLLALLQAESMGLYQHLYRADEIELTSERLQIVFGAAESIHAEFLQDEQRKQALLAACDKVVGARPPVTITVARPAAEPEVDPTEDPGVQELLRRYPGKVIVNREPRN